MEKETNIFNININTELPIEELNNAFIIFIRNSIINKKNSNLLSKENYIELIMLIINIIVDPEYPSQCLREMNKIFEEIIDNKEFIKDKTFIKNIIDLFASKLKIWIKCENKFCSACFKNCSDFLRISLSGDL